MKVFISWSGERSHKVAQLLDNWIQCVLQAVNPWLSSNDIDKGSVWFSEITKELSNTQNGIVCLTKYNINSPWILFEAGALAKGLLENRVYTFLVDLQASEVKDPLAQFNHTTPTKEGVYKLIRTINSGLENNALKPDILTNVFETYWPQFDKQFNEILNATLVEDVKLERPKDEVLNEILNSVRGIDKRLRKVELPEYINRDGIPSNIALPVFQKNVAMVSIDNIDFSPKLYNFLKSRKINFIGEITAYDIEEMDNKNKIELFTKVKELEDIL